MSSTTDLLIKGLAKTLVETPGKKSAPYDTQAEVRRVEGDIAWVHIPGGVDETPVQLTTNAKKGDIVQVRVSGGRAWLYGNQTSPPTDDTKAISAEKKAVTADENATSALTSAYIAKEAADSAQNSANQANSLLNYMEQAAEEADTTLTGIYQDAKDAKESAESADRSAESAYNSASLAINQLGIVEDIVGVLTLVEQNGVYERTLGTTPQQDKWYFERSGSGTEQDPYVYQVVDSVTFEYVLTEDTTVVQNKPYYTRSGSGTEQDPYVYTRVENPTGNPQSQGYYENTGWSYFELTGIDETLQNYISDHIVYAGGVLSLQNGSTRVSLSTDANAGLTFYNAGTQVAQYGSSATIGDPNGYHIVLQNSRLSFYSDAVTEVAFIDGDQLFIKKSVVIQQMDVGDDDGMWSWKIHKVNNANNLYLKWLG